MEDIGKYILEVIFGEGGAISFVLALVIYAQYRMNAKREGQYEKDKLRKEEQLEKERLEKAELNKELVDVYATYLRTIIKATDALGSVNNNIAGVATAQQELIGLITEIKIRLEK